jgi:hypothetical protein
LCGHGKSGYKDFFMSIAAEGGSQTVSAFAAGDAATTHALIFPNIAVR